MELRKEDVQMLREKSRATSQVTFDVDFNVPDAKPDIGRMIQKKDTLRLKEEITLSSNKPNMGELLWNTIEVRGLEFKPEGNLGIHGKTLRYPLGYCQEFLYQGG